MSVRFFGIRHHGPGSARSLVHALEALRPDVVLIEGPPEGDGLLPLAAHPEMKPPVALLVYETDNPSHSVFYPFTLFSPEWQAILYSIRSGVEARFIDLSAGIRFGMQGARGRRQDPLQMLAEAAGYTDSERWWEHLVEERQDDAAVFEAIAEAMAALRPDPLETEDAVEAAREATMRQGIRKAEKDGFGSVAVVCGAWHVPALAATVPVSKDQKTLKGLGKVKTQATWVPWTNGRLALESGYGAGVESPGWYHHLWLHPDDTAAHWMTRVAGLLRSEDLEASPAQTVDAVRLAMTLSALRDRPRPGLQEMNDAALAVFCSGQTVPMRLIRDRLIVGEALGEVPSDTPQVALAEDLSKLQRRLRLKPDASVRELDLDLRNDNDRLRSLLLHQLNLLDIDWGASQKVYGKSGTFHELWRLQWRPELSVQVVEASVWGNTVAEAAAAATTDRLSKSTDLAAVTGLLHQVLLAGLFPIVPVAVGRLEELSALAVDVLALMRAVPSLASVVRYGNVRQTDTAAVAHVLDAMLTRICIGLPGACLGLSDEAARDMLEAIGRVDEAVGLLEKPDEATRWRGALAALVDLQGGSPLLAGRACGLLLDAQVWEPGEGRRRLGLALGAAVEPTQAAAWIEGFLSGRGMLLVHDDRLRGLLDQWVSMLSDETFMTVLPLLRRTFATFTAGERRHLGERLTDRGTAVVEVAWDAGMVAAAQPMLEQLLGVSRE